MKKSLFNSAYIGLMFTGISMISTYWAKGKLAGDGSWPWTLQFFVLWIACSAMIFCIDRIFPKK